MFFIIVGTKMVKTVVKGGLLVRKHCGKCGFLSDLQEFRWRKFLTVFFLPLIPLSNGESVLTCSRCDATFYPQPEDYAAASSSERHSASLPDKTVITCAFCEGKLRIPVLLQKQIMVTCPHCGRRFDVKIDKNA